MKALRWRLPGKAWATISPSGKRCRHRPTCRRNWPAKPVCLSALKKRGQLRGCIGTFAPTQPNIAAEIIQNAVSAGTQDPRFPPVEPAELPELDISVDILSEPERVDGLADLDPKRYGVIVRRGRRSGLLLPDLEGVDRVEEQVAIAMQKAGISPAEEIELYRFSVTRYS